MFFYGISFVLDLLLHTIGACKLWSVLIHICDLSLCVKCVQKIICYYVSAENVYTLVICASVSICFYTTLWISDFLFSWPDCWRFYKHKSSLCAMLILIVKVCSLYSSHFFQTDCGSMQSVLGSFFQLCKIEGTFFVPCHDIQHGTSMELSRLLSSIQAK